MSRCFPFPPPGYERKHRLEDLDILKEAKRKEKKHKKEKKDKERKKDKEKEKYGSDGKHKDKKDSKKRKDKKEKHRDKKKDKEERGKDKEKSSVSEESAVAGKIEEQNGEEEIHPKGQSRGRSSLVDEWKCSIPLQRQNVEKPSQSTPSYRTEPTFVQGLDRRFSDDAKDQGSQLPSRSSVPDEGNCSNPLQRQNERRPSQSSMSFHRTEESKFVQGLDRRFRDVDKDRGNQLSKRVAVSDNGDLPVSTRAAVGNSSGILQEEKDNSNDKGFDPGRRDPQGIRNSSIGHAMVPNFHAVSNSKVRDSEPPEAPDNGSEGKEKYKETGEDKRGDKKKDREKKGHRKEKDKEKEKKKEKAEVNIESKKSDQNKSIDVGKNGFIDVTVNKCTQLLNDANSSAVNEDHLRKRKDRERNGFLHGSEIRPDKMQRPAPHQASENSKKLETCLIPTDKRDILNSFRVDNKDRLMNGTIGAQNLPPFQNKLSPAPVSSVQTTENPRITQSNSNHLKDAGAVPNLEDQIAEASRRPPHPDSKHLGELLMLPIVRPWPENDDQDWLYNTKGSSLKPKTDTAGVKEEPHVWSEAVHIESVDICALPYVIPY